MEVPFMAWVFQGIPESIGTAAVVISLGLHKLHWKLIIIIGLIQAVLMYTVRLLPLTFGVHTVILIISLSLLSTWIAKIDLRKAIIYSNISIMILAITEFIFVFSISSLGLYSENIIFGDTLTRIFVGMPHVIVLFLTAMFFSKKKVKLKNIMNIEG